MKTRLPTLIRLFGFPLLSLLLLGLFNSGLVAKEVLAPSPENHVYQYMTQQSFTAPGFKTSNTTAYLWIPPSCRHVRGLLVMGHNVPEQELAGNPLIREVCTEQSLAILFTCPSFRMSDVCAAKESTQPNLTQEHSLTAPTLTWAEKCSFHKAFLQQILDALAKESGFKELSTAPLLPMGESMSLLVVDLVTNAFPERCIAGIWIKDQHINHALPGLPTLSACGTGAEWDAPKFDPFNRWRDMATDDEKKFVEKRTAMPDWPGSLLVEAGSAHFSCTEEMASLIAKYIRSAAKARLPILDGSALIPVDLKSGFVASLPVPGIQPVKPKSYLDCTPGEQNLPWYFDKESAQAAYDLANINWDAKTQMPAFLDNDGNPLPFNNRGVFTLSPPVMEPDGITFTVRAAFLDKLPADFVKGNSPLTHVAGTPKVEWLKGPAIPLANNRFQLALDRSAAAIGTQEILFRAIHPGDADYRLSVIPAFLTIPRNKAGNPQTITFEAIPDQPAGKKEVLLHATSDSGLPVHFFVKAGPAKILGNKLVFSDIPEAGTFPISITVVAWQWGNASFQTAPVVERTFQITKE